VALLKLGVDGDLVLSDFLASLLAMDGTSGNPKCCTLYIGQHRVKCMLAIAGRQKGAASALNSDKKTTEKEWISNEDLRHNQNKEGIER